jgi:hypothetical protein
LKRDIGAGRGVASEMPDFVAQHGALSVAIWPSAGLTINAPLTNGGSLEEA